MCPGTIVEDESEVPLTLELEEKSVVLELGVVEAPPQAPLAFELVKQPPDAKDLHREEQSNGDPP